MEESPVSRWFPLNRAWFLENMLKWEDSWVKPIMRLLLDMWPVGAALEDRDELLARTAGVPLKTWIHIRRETGLFWVVKDGRFTQPFLAAEFEVAIEKAAKHAEKSSKGGRAKQEKAKQRLAEEIAAQAASSGASSTASGSATGTTSGTPQALPMPHTRAGEGELSDKEERREYAKAVPKPAYVEACFLAYPRERRGKGATTRIVAIPDDARVRIARFLLDRPEYPLLRVFRAIAKTMDFPPAMADVLTDPPHPDSLLRAAGDDAAGPKLRPGEAEEIARREAEEAAWRAMTPAEQERVKQEAQARLDRTLGRRTA